MPWRLLAILGVLKSHGAHAATACNEKSAGVTKILGQSTDVTECNESEHPDEPITLFVTFRYMTAPAEDFRYTPCIFVTFGLRRRPAAFENTQDRPQRPEGRRDRAPVPM